MGGLILVRLQGPGSLLPWAGARCSALLAFWPFARLELAIEEPLIDVRLLATPAQWPVQLTAFLFGMSVLGAQIPLSTFARTDPDEAGFGLGASASFVSTLIGVYVIALVTGALLLPVVAGSSAPRRDAGRLPAGRARLRAVPAAARLDRPDPGQHGDRRGRLGRPGGRAAPRPLPRRHRPTAPAS